MPDKTYLQAASVKTLVNAMMHNSGWDYITIDGRVISFRDIIIGDTSEPFISADASAELLRRFAALEAERDSLKARLAEAERLLADIITPNDCRAPNATPVTEVDIVDFLTRDVEPDTKPTAEGEAQ